VVSGGHGMVDGGGRCGRYGEATLPVMVDGSGRGGATTLPRTEPEAAMAVVGGGST
jgi:hypothetical protein